MYERSVIVLERYTEEMLGFNKSNNLKNNYYTYKDMVEEEKSYKEMLEEEEEVLQKFDEIAKTIQEMQREQEKLYKNNKALEEERFSLFYDFDTKPEIIEKKLIKIESQNEKNIEESQELRKKYIDALVVFMERQTERNQCARKKKGIDRNHMQTIEKTKKLFEMINIEDVKKAKNFIGIDKNKIKEELLKIMTDNGKSERVPFDENVLRNAIDVRIDIATREAQCYVLIYNKLRRLLSEIDNDNILLARYEKVLRDVTVKTNFLNAEKEYIVGFLDNERMTAMNGVQIHKKMMKEACINFEEDIKQIDNLYELIVREAANKSTNKAYDELYNNTYLKEIEEKEKDFEQEITNVRIRTGAVINSNYWRIESIKNIYTVFQTEVTEKFGKDLSIYKDEEEDKYEDEFLSRLYQDIDSQEEKKEEKYDSYEELEDEIEDEFGNEYEEEFEELEEDNDLKLGDYDEFEDDDDIEIKEFDDDDDIYDDDDEFGLAEYSKKLDELDEYEFEESFEKSEEDFDQNTNEELEDFEIFDEEDYGPKLEKSINSKRIPENNSTKKRTLRIKRTTAPNTNNIDNTEIIVDSNEKNNMKKRKKNKVARINSNNTSNTEFSKYLNNELKKKEKVIKNKNKNLDEMVPGGITEITPKPEKNKSKGLFSKILKTNKAIKDSRTINDA